jgi:prephenate dehydrogenase
VTSTPRTSAAALDRVAGFWSALGSKVKTMSPADHDRALALTSHLPHLLAAALAGALPPDLHELTATGFRDTTRIAAGDPRLWTAIFAQNRTPVLEALGRLEGRLHEFRQALESGNNAAVDQFLAQAKEVRDALGN